MTLNFCTGHGQFETQKQTGDDYQTISGAQIAAMVANPPATSKESAQWFIPSTYCASDARSHDAQRTNGQFWFLTLDIDDNNLTLDDVRSALDAVLGDVAVMVYSTRSARPQALKWRALIPLKDALDGQAYADTQAALFDLLEDASAGTLIADRALARAGQLVYLPNRGEVYQHHIHKAARLNLDGHVIAQHRDQKRTAMAMAQIEAKPLQQRRSAPIGAETSPVDAFNRDHSLSDLLPRYGFERDGQSQDYRSQMQNSKSYATRCYDGYAISLSASDDVAGLGKVTPSGARVFDAFDLFVHFEHGGDFQAAVRSYGAEIKPTQVETTTSTPHVRNDDFEVSHDALALSLGAASWDRDARYITAWSKWAFWTGSRWEVDDRLDHMTRARDYLRSRATTLMAWAEKQASTQDEKDGKRAIASAKAQATDLRNRATVVAVEALARSNDASRANPDDFDQNKDLIGTPTGTVDLRTAKLKAAMRADMITKATRAGPKKQVPVIWLRFLAETFGGDQDVIEFMQRAAGYALTGHTREHKMLFLHGGGRNGKSVFLNVLSDLFGDYARRASSSVFLNKKSEGHPTDLAGLQGARLVIGSELDKGRTWDEATIKDLTGGDTMTARYMRGDYFDFTPQLTLMVAGNNMPSFRGVDEAIRARVVLVPFNHTVPKERRDPCLPAKLATEAPAILQWCIDGAVQWYQRGLDVPEAIQAASDEYFNEEDTLGQFITDELVETVGAITTADVLHHRFDQWATGQGLAPWTQRTLVKELRGRGYADAKTNGKRGLRGLKCA